MQFPSVLDLGGKGEPVFIVMTRRTCGWTLALILFFAPYVSRAWDPYGHMMVAQVAYDRLNPRAKAAVDGLAAEIKSPDASYTFVTLACWMDDLRTEDPKIPFSGQFKPWHYITWGHKESDANPPLELGNDEESKKGNVIIGLKRSLAVLKGGSDPEIPDKAHALAILIHLTGDVHQPLHCGSRYFNENGKTANDAGGNRVAIDNAPTIDIGLGKPLKPNLHSFWDAAYRAKFDTKKDMAIIEENYADYTKKDMELLKPLLAGLDKYAPEPGVSMEPDFVAWAKEGNKLAADFAYAKLPRLSKDRYAVVDDLYTIKSVELARAQIVLAGHRLAALLNSTLGSEP